MGVGWYRTRFDADPDKKTTLVFDGAMSEARVYVNGKRSLPSGLSVTIPSIVTLLSFCTKKEKTMYWLYAWKTVLNLPTWYPGAGLYRNVHLITAEKIHVPVWGTQITTPHVANDYASVCLRTSLQNVGKEEITIETEILDPNGKKVSFKKTQRTHQSRTAVYAKFHCGKPTIVVARNTVLISGRL